MVVRATTRERTFKSALVEQSAIKPGHMVLDLASGTGTLAIWLKVAQPNAVVIGVDGDAAMLQMATRKAREAKVSIQFDLAFSHSLPYPSAYFDRAVSTLFFHHLNWENKQRTARELFRVLRPGGQLHVADWGRPANALMRGLFYPVQLLDGYENTQDNVNDRLVPMFQEAGFADVQQKRTFDTILGTLALYSATKRG